MKRSSASVVCVYQEARENALYYDPDVIVLEEATSALDNETERRVVSELNAMRGGRTLIVIAHRLTTLQKCNEVFLL